VHPARDDRVENEQPACLERWLAGAGQTTHDNYSFVIPLRSATQKRDRVRSSTIEHATVRKRDRDRAEALRLAGGLKPSLRERAVALIREKGEVRTAELTAIGIPRCYLTPMCEEGLIVRVAYGRYRLADRNAA